MTNRCVAQRRRAARRRQAGAAEAGLSTNASIALPVVVLLHGSPQSSTLSPQAELHLTLLHPLSDRCQGVLPVESMASNRDYCFVHCGPRFLL